MNVTTIQNVTPTQTPAKTTSGTSLAAQAAKATEQAAMAQDQVDIKSGFMPSLKGAGAGLVASSVATMGTVIIWDKVAHLAEGGLALLAIPMIGVPAGTIAGAVTSNVTDDKLKGTLIGAGIGAAAGAIQAGATLKTVGGALAGAVIGAVSGAIGGFTGTLTAQQK